MKNSRKCIFKSIVCMLLSIIIIGTSSIYSSAATTSYKKVSSGEKVGDYYIWIDEPFFCVYKPSISSIQI